MALRTVFQHAVKSFSNSGSILAAHSARPYSKFVNHIELLGRVGKEPQKIGANEAVTFPFFTESVAKLKDGTVKTYPCWHKILVLRRAMADVVFQNLERGQRCYISGRVAYRAPETGPDGRLIHSQQAAIVADNIVFLEKSRKNKTEEPDASDFVKESAVSGN